MENVPLILVKPTSDDPGTGNEDSSYHKFSFLKRQNTVIPTGMAFIPKVNATSIATNIQIQPAPPLRTNKKTKTEPKTSFGVAFLGAGLAACIADVVTFPLDTVKVRLQVCDFHCEMLNSQFNSLQFTV